MVDQRHVATLQALALVQRGDTESSGGLLEELATEAPGSETLGEYGRYILLTGQFRPKRSTCWSEAFAHGGSAYRRAAEDAAATAGLSTDAVAIRLDVRRPIVPAEQALRAIGERLER